MTIRVKRIAILIFCMLSMMFTMFIPAIQANASSHELIENVFTYSHRFTHNYSKSTVYPGWTGITYNKAGYENSYKYVTYAEFSTSDSGTNRYRYETDGEAADTVVTGGEPTVKSKCFKREHYTEIRYTSTSTSSIKESNIFYIIKY